MASQYDIEINFHEAHRQAQKLYNEYLELNNLYYNTIPNLMNSVYSGWQGDAASAFYNKLSELRNQVYYARNKTYDAYSTIITVADSYYNAEMNALRIAQERSFGGGGGGAGGR